MCSHTHISIWLKKEKKQGTSLAVQCLRLCLSWWLNGRIFLQCRRRRLDPWVGRIPWRRKWQPTPEFLPGEFHGQRSLAGYSPWSHTESDMTEGQTLSLFSISGSVGSIPGRGTKILLATRHGQKKKKIHNRTMSFFYTSVFDYLILSKKHISPCDPACMHTYATETVVRWHNT